MNTLQYQNQVLRMPDVTPALFVGISILGCHDRVAVQPDARLTSGRDILPNAS